MLGHKAFQLLSSDYDTWTTIRRIDQRIKLLKLSDREKIIENVDCFSFKTIEHALQMVQPDIVLNCIGIIKQLKESNNNRIIIYINSYLPHLLAEYCNKHNIKFIQISTDCIFSGEEGDYSENDVSDAEDLYGQTKYLGEVSYGENLTLRTSIIGHELLSSVSLVDWFINNTSPNVEGYKNAIYTGFPTCIFIKEISRLIKDYPKLSGLYHIASDPITKYDLLYKINEIYCLNKKILPNKKFICNRSLNYSKYKIATNFQPLSWEEMINSMYKDYIKTNYNLMEV